MAIEGLQQETREERRIADEVLFEKLSSSNPLLVKQAVDKVTDFTRTKVREDGIYRRIMPPIPVTNSDLTRSVETDKPFIVVDKEPDSPAAVTVPFATLPTNLYIRGPRYKVGFARIRTERYAKDVDELRSWDMDIRQVLSDNSIKDMLAEEDSRFLSAVNTSIVGPGVVVKTSGVVQHEEIVGGITRDSLWDGFKVLPSTPSNLEVSTVLTNHLTIKNVAKMARDEMGGDIAENIMRSGWTLDSFMGVDWIVTIKKGLVPTNTFFHFGDPKFIGKSYILEDTTMYIDRKAFMIEFFAYETIGGAIGNTNGVARIDYK